MKRPAIGSVLLLASVSACAMQTPAFDRPGISFAPSVLPAHTFDWEQGFPDFEHDSSGGIDTTRYTADTDIRIGLGHHLEVQLAGSPFNVLETRAGGQHETNSGIGDTSLGMKIALPSSQSDLSWAALALVNFPTGAAAFTAHQPSYDLGVTAGLTLGDRTTGAFEVNATHGNGATTWSLSPQLGYALNDRLGVYAEAGVTFDDDGEAGSVAGGGVTWMLTPVIQLDLSADFGLDARAPDVTGGAGFAVFFG